MEKASQASISRVGVLGGTFDPIHVGHLVAASEVLHSFALDRVIFMPAGDPWQRRAEAPAEDRFMMVSMAIGGFAGFAASRLEIDRKGPTYSADSFETLTQFFGDDVSFFLIVGADAVLNLATWKKLDRLRELVEIVAVTRPGSDLRTFRQTAELPHVHIQEMPGVDISGSLIRERIRRGEPIDFFVPSDVAKYIRRNALYAGTATRSA